MKWTAVSGHLLKWCGQAAAALLLYAILRDGGFYEFTARETEGLNTLILLLGSIYAVVLAFAIFVIWGQFTDVENCVMRECNSLNDLLQFSDYVNPDAGRKIRRGVADYAQHVMKAEWAALGDGRRDRRADELFTETITDVMRIAPATPAEESIYLRLVDIARKAGERRAERVTKSLTRIPATMFWFVNTIAWALLLLVFVYPFHQWLAGAACFLLVFTVLSLARFVMSDMDNPLKGAWNVSARPFQELKN